MSKKPRIRCGDNGANVFKSLRDKRFVVTTNGFEGLRMLNSAPARRGAQESALVPAS